MKTKIFLLILCLSTIFSCSPEDTSEVISQPDESVYFPPSNSDIWETKTIQNLNWNESELQPLLNFLEDKNSKSFMILHNGKIVVEAYMNGHDATKPWYWASAGKTLTTAVTGIAEDNGLLNINKPVSEYLGAGWTSAPLEKENLITGKHLLSMNSGLDDTTQGLEPSNLQYVADAGTRWAYHGVFFKLQDIIASESNTSWTNYFNTNLRDKIGMTGQWLTSGNSNVYWSTTRSMARFGLLTLAKGKWESTQIIPEDFLNDAISTSQDINDAYGYMWWLNGKTSYHLPQSQRTFNGELIPNAPDDMVAGLGKNDQKIYVIPSKGLVIVRMGDAADTENFALSSFDDDLWEKINALIN